jgi:hypothetical protein
MVISLEELERGIYSSEPCLTSFYGGNVMTGFKAQEATGHCISRERSSRAYDKIRGASRE